MSVIQEGNLSDEAAREPHTTPKPFRFKREQRAPSSPSRDADEQYRARSHRHNHRHHSRKRKRRRVEDEQPPSASRPRSSSLHPDIAFRESLFDALGDEEGADFWQGVYGQPIHNYSRIYEDAETGVLDSMDDEQYAQYVRRKMWEKSTEGLEAAREAKRQERKHEEQARRRQRAAEPQTEDSVYNNFTFDFELEASLRRGEVRKERKKWQQIWHDYVDKWKELQELCETRKRVSADNVEQVYLRNKIAWPVETGNRKDVTPDHVEHFINNVCTVPEDGTKLAILKSERIRWHPDKIQQRYGFMNIDDGTMGGVTAVFQVLDRMWNDLRNRES